MSLRIRSLIFNILYWVWTVLCASTTVVTIFFPPRISQVTQVWWSWGLDLMLRKIVGAGVTKTGLENIPDTPCIFASQHQSSWDTSAFQRVVEMPAFVLKRELMYLPVFGFYLKLYGMIPIDRSAGASAIRAMVRKSRKIIGDGRSIVIFPEGTRTQVNSDPNYYPGVYALYALLRVPVVPVALNSGEVWSRHTSLRYPGQIRMCFLPPIQPGLERSEFMDRLSSAIESASSSRRAKDSSGTGEKASSRESGSGESADLSKVDP